MPEEKTEVKAVKQKSPKWVKLKPKEIEEKIVELAKEGNAPEKIGLILRDKHGIPSTRSAIDKKISQVLKETDIEFESEETKTNNKIRSLKSHIDKNKHDYSAQRTLTKKLWTLHSLKN
jgi:small subunit ribosomal protein S15